MNATQKRLFFEDIWDAQKYLVGLLGGAKVIGPKLWPQKSAEAAANALRDALNPNRAEKLDMEQFMLLLRFGREAGHHDLMEYMAADLSYTQPVPIDPEDQAAALLASARDLGQQLSIAVGKLERIATAPSPSPLRRAK
jgi:hypothetical protein